MKDRLGFYMREQAISHGVPCFTCLDTVKRAVDLPQKVVREARSMDEYYQLNHVAITNASI
jgi:hypothetical protein